MGDELVICLVVQGPGGLFYKYHSYAWTGMAVPVAECVWEGTWTSNLGDVVLRREGDKLTGTYPHDQGRIEGVVVSNTLTGMWAEAPSYESPNDSGDLEITLSADCQSFSAKWRYGSSGEWKADWAGQRSK